MPVVKFNGEKIRTLLILMHFQFVFTAVPVAHGFSVRDLKRSLQNVIEANRHNQISWYFLVPSIQPHSSRKGIWKKYDLELNGVTIRDECSVEDYQISRHSLIYFVQKRK